MSHREEGRVDQADSTQAVRRTHVLVVDDSAVVREIVGGALRARPGVRVSAAHDGVKAEEMVKKDRPDVIVLDLEMPRMDGLTFLRRLMADDPIPVVVCSGLAETGTVSALRALDAGAVSVLAKPRVGVRDFLHESAGRLVETVLSAAGTRLRRRASATPTADPASGRGASLAAARPGAMAKPPAQRPSGGDSSSRIAAPRALLARTFEKVIAIGASTGGTEAIRRVLEAMPFDAPGIVIVQHMPPGFTAAFAASLDRDCLIEVREARTGDRVVPGRALIAPGDRHLTYRRRDGKAWVEVGDGDLVSGHRPSVDMLFRSVALEAGSDAVGVLLTGMGDDGAEGLLEMRRAGAATLAQDEATSVVFGMPRAAMDRGAAQSMVALDEIPGAILRRLAPAGAAVGAAARAAPTGT